MKVSKPETFGSSIFAHGFWANADDVIAMANQKLQGKPGYFDASIYELPNDNSSFRQYEKGSYRMWLYSPGCLVGIRDSHAIADYDTRVLIENYVSIEVIISGGYDQLTAFRELPSTDMPRIYLTSHTQGGHQLRHHRAKSKTRSLGIWVKPKLLIEQFGIDIKTFPDGIQRIFALTENQTLTLSVTNEIKTLTEEIISPPFSGKLQVQYLQAKFTELFCQLLDHFSSPGTRFSSSSSLNIAKSRALTETMATLDNQFADPPSVVELADNVAMSRSTLLATFKEGLGITISQYVNRRRMEAARELLKDRELSISDVAQKVGFEDHSSFSRSFKRLYGFSPQQQRNSP